MNQKIETLCVQAGYTPKNGEPRVLPITQTTTYAYDTAQQMGALFDLTDPGFMYTRLGSPTQAAVEAKLNLLEGGSGAMLTATGQSAVLLAVLNICKNGDHIICTSAVYGGTFNLFASTLPKYGIETTFIHPDATDAEIDAAFKSNTKLVYGETLANPALIVFDIERFAKAAHAHGVPVMVDNTFATPVLCRPFDFGADIIVHSTSKYMDGHSVVMGGVIIESGKFNWDNGNFPDMVHPDPSYHGTSFYKTFGEKAYITKCRTVMMRDLGPTIAPIAAFLLNLGLETLHLRMPCHSENALVVAQFLEGHDKVAWVNYPGLESSPYHALQQKYLPNGASGVISFGTKAGRAASEKLMESLKLARMVVHVADARTCVLHPASTTHRQLTDQQLVEADIKPEMLRFSVGIENKDDIIADLEQALAQI